MFCIYLLHEYTDYFLSSQPLKRNSYLQPIIPLEQPEQQLQETVR